MEAEAESFDPKETGTKTHRPLLLTLLCLFSFVYFGLVSLLFFAGLINYGWITRATNQFVVHGGNSTAKTFLIFSAGFLLHTIAFTGILLIWQLRKMGYFFLGPSCLLIAAFQLFNPLTALTSVAIYIILVFLFGIFYRRMN